jgi:hypothetical protein
VLVNKPLDPLIKEFVSIYGKMSDVGLDVFMEPILWFMPIESNLAKKEAAHYFLLAASLSDTEVTGNSRNVRVLLDDLHDIFGQTLYSVQDEGRLESRVDYCESSLKLFDQLGTRKDEIPKIIVSVNKFVEEKAVGDLVEHAKQLVRAGKKQADLVEEFRSIHRMGKLFEGKSWIYLRWMVRNKPDLGIMPFNPVDLQVPLTTPLLRVVAALELLNDGGELAEALISRDKTRTWWENAKGIEVAKKALNDYSRSLFPEDPAKVDFPFFVLGRWLSGFDLTNTFLEKSVHFLIDKYLKFRTWPVRYLVGRTSLNRFSCSDKIGAKSTLEVPTAEFLLKNNIRFEFEPMQFWYSQEHGVIALPPPYTPDFLLGLKYHGKRVLVEPHGIWEDFEAFMGKLHLFRKNYAEFFYLILVVPRGFEKLALDKDQKQPAFDQLWTIEDFETNMISFGAVCSSV